MFRKRVLKPSFIAAVLLSLSYVCFCIYYLINSHQRLLADYLSVGDCFFHAQKFVEQDFVTATKERGDIMCWLALPLVLWLSYRFLFLKIRALWNAALLYLSKQLKRPFWPISLLLLCLGLSYYGFQNNALCTDEAFSAHNFATAPIQRLLTYYPLPNHHILFNLLNHFAGRVFNDYILSGRIISICCYCFLMLGNFFLLRRFCRYDIVIFLCCVLLSVQFLVWGFGHQARAYALCYLLEWMSLLCFYYYFFSTGSLKQEALTLLFFCTVLGMWTLPVFFFMWSFQCLAVLVLMLYRKQLYLQFWLYGLMSLVGVFLVYLPVFCYSGIGAVLGNDFVSGHAEINRFEALASFVSYIKDIMLPQALGWSGEYWGIALALLMIPYVLYGLFRKRSKGLGRLLFLHTMVWVSMLLVIAYTNRLPAARLIGAQLHFILLFILLSALALMEGLHQRRQLAYLIFSFCIGAETVNMCRFDQENSHIALYGQDTRSFMNALKEMPLDFEANQSIWLSDESFMWPFLLKGFPNVVSHDCNFDHQDILFLSEDDKGFPDSVLQQYTLKSTASWFRVYQKK